MYVEPSIAPHETAAGGTAETGEELPLASRHRTATFSAPPARPPAAALPSSGTRGRAFTP